MEKATQRKMITEITGPVPDTKLWEYEDYAHSFWTAAIDYVLDSDSTETARCDVTEAQEHEVFSDVTGFLFADDGHHYRLITGHGLTAESAGAEYAAVRSRHGGKLINDEVTEAIKVYNDFNIF